MLNMGLGFAFTAQDMASGVMKGLERNFNSLDKRTGIGAERINAAFGSLGTGIAIMGAGAATLGGAFALADMAGKFEASIAMVGAVADASADQIKQLEAAAIQAGIATQFSPTEATAGLRELAQAGFNVTDSIKLLQPVLDMAAGSMGELTPGAAAGLAAQTLKAFGIEVEKASESVDKLLKGAGMFALSAGELPAAIGIVSRGAQALNQSLDETIISFGLVKNIVPGVERASTAVAVAMERMANPKVQKAMEEIGVHATDAEHRFRPFLDIMGDLVPALDKMTEQERAAFVTETFGAHALAGMNAIMKQVKDGVTTSTGEIVKGAAAIKYLRTQIGEAGGTAEKMRKIFLGTFEGQKKLLAGSMETLGITLGQAFTPITGAIVEVFTGAVNGVIGLFNSMPAGVRTGLAKVVIALGGVLLALGSILAAKGVVVLLTLAMQALGVSLGAIAAAAAPVIAVFAAATIAVSGFQIAYERNLGGIRDFTESTLSKIGLAWEGAMQLFEQGGFSGAVLQELDKAENQGIQRFAINVYLWMNRISGFFNGIAQGFSDGVQSFAPSFEAFMGTVRELGVALGFLSQNDAPERAGAMWERFADAGHMVGDAFAGVFAYLVAGARIVVAVFTGIVDVWPAIAQGFGAIGNAISELGAQLSHLFGTDQGIGKSMDTWRTLGMVIGGVIAGIVGAIGIVISVISAAVSVVSGVVGAISSLIGGLAGVLQGYGEIISGIFSGNWAMAWKGAARIVFSVVDAIMGAVLSMVGGIGGMVDALANTFGAKLDLKSTLGKWKSDAHASLVNQADNYGAAQAVPPAGTTGAPMPAPKPASDTMPAVAALAATAAPRASAPTVVQVQPAAIPPITLVADGQQLATVVVGAMRSGAGREFSPVPSI